MNTKNHLALGDLNAKSDVRGGASKTAPNPTGVAPVKVKGKKDIRTTIVPEAMPPETGLGRVTEPTGE
jgi:hypothetical protein